MLSQNNLFSDADINDTGSTKKKVIFKRPKSDVEEYLDQQRFLSAKRAEELMNLPITEKIINSVCGVVNEQHLKDCDCQNDLIREKQKERMRDTYEDLKDKGKHTDSGLLRRRFFIDKAKGINDVAIICEKNMVACPHEVEALTMTIDRFDAKYDLEDPRAYMIVRSVLNHQISVLRMQLYSNMNGIITYDYDKEGNPKAVLNPVEESKRRFDEAIVKAVVELDKIFEGSKIQLKGTIATVKIEDLFGKIIEGEEEEIVREI